MSVKIIGTGKGLPKNHVKNADLPKELNSDDEWVRSHTGIAARYIASGDESTVTMGIEAARNAMKKAGLTADDIQAVICTTISAEQHNLPANACMIQDALGIKNAACFDVCLACTGFICGIDLAASQLTYHNWKYALVISTEKLSGIADWTDRSTCVLFGDGSGAVVLENDPNETESGIVETIVRSDGSGAQALALDDKGLLRMDGHLVYDFAVRTNVELITTLLNNHNLTIDDVDWIVCHQANERILKAAAKRLHFDESKFFMCMDRYGNTSSASIPLALDDMVEQGKLKKGMKIISVGFGAGLSYGGTYIRW
ncbi:MAG: ketoacyl-ACP synthase III [Treponema sp.]|nr:ketoacyl-ACP synthase III [Treponema sp.]